MAKKPSPKQDISVHKFVLQMDSRAGFSRPAPKTGRPLTSPKTSFLTEMRVQVGPSKPAIPTTKARNSQRSGSKRPNPEIEGKSGRPKRFWQFKGPYKPGGFDNAYLFPEHRRCRDLCCCRLSEDRELLISAGCWTSSTIKLC